MIRKHENKSIVLVLIQILAFCIPVCAQHNPFEYSGEFTANNRIDTLIIRSFRKKGIKPANLCSDAVFIRRVYLDVIGTLPEPKEVREFLQNRSGRKRAALIHELLRRDEFADYWSLKWCDLLRQNFPSTFGPMQCRHIIAGLEIRLPTICLTINLPARF